MKLQGIGCIRMGPTINVLAWNARGLNCLMKQRDVTRFLRTFSCDVAILQESKLEIVSRPIAISLWGCCLLEWLYLLSVGCSRGIIAIWDHQVLELANSRIGSFSDCCMFKSLEDDFECGQIGVYVPNDGYLWVALFEELLFFYVFLGHSMVFGWGFQCH